MPHFVYLCENQFNMRFITFLVLLLFTASAPLLGEGIAFFEGNFEEAKQAASEEGKIIFVDAYTSWCGPCKRMSKNVFPQAKVGDFYNSNFVNLKIDMEKGEGPSFRQKYGVNAFPTLLFIEPGGKVVHRVTGGMDQDRFLKLGQAAAKKGDVSSALDKEYEAGERDATFIAKYVTARARSGKSVIKLANEYLATKPDLTSEDAQQILFYGTSEADSRVFNIMVSQKAQLVETFGAEAYNAQIEKACNATVNKAIQFRNADLVEEAVDKHDKFILEKNENYGDEARIRYYGAMDDVKNYLKYAKRYSKIGEKQKVAMANSIIKHMRHQPEAVKAGENWSSEVAKKNPTVDHLYLLAQLQMLSGKNQMALESAREALAKAEAEKAGNFRGVQSLIKVLEAQDDEKTK